jgi:hypothetical protein
LAPQTLRAVAPPCVHRVHKLHSQQVLEETGDHRLNVFMFDRTNGQPVEAFEQQANTRQETPMKKIFLAVALVVAFAAPAMAEQFGNPYSQH